MKSTSNLALKELLDDSAKVIEEYQAQCFLMASEFKELAKGNMTYTYDYPTFKNEIKRIRYTSNTVKKEVTNINQILFNEDENSKGYSYIDSFLIEMAKRTRKPLGQSFMKKVRRTFPATPYKNIRIRIIKLISEGKIIDYTEEDEARRDPTKSKRGHPRTKMLENSPLPNLTKEQLLEIEKMLPPQQLQLIQQQAQQLQQSQQIQQNLQLQNNQDLNTNQNANNISNSTGSGNSQNHMDEAAMAAAVAFDLQSSTNRFDTMSDASEEDTIDFETEFDQAVGFFTESPTSKPTDNTSEPTKNEAT